MSNTPEELQYSKSHEWIRSEGDEVVVGITDHAQELLGDMVFVELPEVGTQFSAEEDCAVVESVKAASDIYAPIDGEITAINEDLADSPESINQEPYESGWLFRMKPSNTEQLGTLLDVDAYRELVANEDH